MNDFEQKLARQNFREPPAGLRAEILRACAAAPAAWTWRDWLWPAPPAWAALAALWLVFAAVQFGERRAAPLVVQPAPDAAALLTFYNTRAYLHDLDLAR